MGVVSILLLVGALFENTGPIASGCTMCVRLWVWLGAITIMKDGPGLDLMRFTVYCFRT